MRETRLIWDMPVTIEIVDRKNYKKSINKVFDYFRKIDQIFNTFDPKSEISKINHNELSLSSASKEIGEVLELSEKTKEEAFGYFEYFKDGKIDPLGIVKGWAVHNACDDLKKEGYKNFYIEAGGDIESAGLNENYKPWTVGIKNPFNQMEIIKKIYLTNCGIATSGTYIRGNHIYDPFSPEKTINDIVSLTVIGPNILEADRFATAAFAMGKNGIYFIEKINGLEGYMIDKNGKATYTSGFEKFLTRQDFHYL